MSRERVAATRWTCDRCQHQHVVVAESIQPGGWTHNDQYDDLCLGCVEALRLDAHHAALAAELHEAVAAMAAHGLPGGEVQWGFIRWVSGPAAGVRVDREGQKVVRWRATGTVSTSTAAGPARLAVAILREIERKVAS